MKRTILTTAAFAAVILLASVANAQTQWGPVGGIWNGNWNDPAHWTAGVPNAALTAVLPAGVGAYTVQMNLAVGACKTLTMHSDATLQVQVGNALQFGNADGQFSRIDGKIELLGNGSTLRFVNSHTVFGFGTIDGQGNNAAIEISNNKTLTNAMTIEGNCQIVPAVGSVNTTFINNGTVHANNAGTLWVAPNSIGFSSGLWLVSTNANAVLQIGAPSAVLHGGSINVFNGTLDIDEDFGTTGNLTFTNVTIDVATGKTLSAS